MSTRTAYRTLSEGRLDPRHVALRLFQKAKRLGIWDPAGFDFRQDAEDWQRLEAPERDLLTHLAALFVAGEESVTLDLLPLVGAIARAGLLEEEMYLTSFLWEEAKHVELFDRFLREVAGVDGDLHEYPGANYEALFGVALPRAMHRLDADDGADALARASVTYNMIVEGVLAETGYHAWYTILSDAGIMPATVEAIRLVQRDEARHVRFGVHLLSRLIAEHGDPVWQAVQEEMMALMPTAVGVFGEAFETQHARHGRIPFDLDPEVFADFAMRQFRKRMARLESARHASLTSVLFGDPDHDPEVNAE